MQSAGPKSGSLSDQPTYNDRSSQDSSCSEGDYEDIPIENDYDDDAEKKNFFQEQQNEDTAFLGSKIN